MTGFILISLVLLALASGFVAVPLWRPALDSAGRAMPPRRGAAVALPMGLLGLTAFLYAMVGQPQGLAVEPGERTEASAGPGEPAQPARDGAPQAEGPAQGSGAGSGGMTQAQIEGMVARLAARLEKQPQDEQGWRMLVRSYETLGRFPEAVQAYQRLIKLAPTDIDLLLNYAVALGMAEGRSLAGAPEAVIEQALTLSPGHPQALALSGSAAFERHDYAKAVARWKQLLREAPPDADLRASIERNVAQAEALLAEGKQLSGKSGAP